MSINQLWMTRLFDSLNSVSERNEMRKRNDDEKECFKLIPLLPFTKSTLLHLVHLLTYCRSRALSRAWKKRSRHYYFILSRSRNLQSIENEKNIRVKGICGDTKQKKMLTARELQKNISKQKSVREREIKVKQINTKSKTTYN